VPTVLKSGSLNLLEPLGPVQACNGIALPLRLPLPFYCCFTTNSAAINVVLLRRYISITIFNVDLRKRELGKIEFNELLFSTEENVGEGVYLTTITHCMQLQK